MKSDSAWSSIAIAFLMGVNMSLNSVIIPYAYATPETGAIGGKVAGVIAGGARSVMCPLYRDYPAFMTGSWANSPMADYNDGFLNEFCAPAGQLPEPPTPPFTGGQCVGVRYRISGSVTLVNGETLGIGGVFEATISSVKIEDTGNNNQGEPTVSVIARGTLRNPTRPLYGNLLGPLAPGAKLNAVSITREDGLPDNCGNPKPAYPITRPPDVSLRPTIPVQISPNFNILAPVTVFAPITNLTPTLKIGDFNVKFDLGGLEISPSINLNPPGSSPNGSPPVQPSPSDNPSSSPEDIDTEEILKYLRRLRECQKCDLDYDFSTTGSTSGRSGSVSIASSAIALAAELSVVNEPSNPRFMPGLGQPDFIQCGWCWFEGNGFLSERTPIDARTKVYYAPESRVGLTFRFTMWVGFTGSARMVYKVKKNPLPPL